METMEHEEEKNQKDSEKGTRRNLITRTGAKSSSWEESYCSEKGF
jgi:hypothetical protein